MWQVLIVAFSRCFQNAVVMGKGRLLWWSREPGSHRSLGSSSSVDPRILPQATFFNRRFGWGVSLPHRLPHFMSHIVVAALLVDTSPCPPAAPTAHRRSLSSFCDQWSPANNSDQWSEGWSVTADITTFSGAVANNRTLNVAKLNPRPFCSNWWEWKHEAAPMARGRPYLKQKKVKFYLKISNNGWVKFLQSCWSVSKTYLWHFRRGWMAE